MTVRTHCPTCGPREVIPGNGWPRHTNPACRLYDPPALPSNPHEITSEMREATRLLMLLTEEQRGLVLCWFCPGCWRYVGPGDFCHCRNDE